MKRFLKGPIPWLWIVAAMGLRGSALAVGVSLWLWSGIRRSRSFPISLSRLPIPRAAASRGLRDLEQAALVRVRRRPGRRTVVTIVDQA